MYIETERLILRRMTEDDFEDFLEYAPDPERCRMMGTEPLRGREDTLEIFRWLLFNEKRFYAIVLRSENKVIGHIEVHNNPAEADCPDLAGRTGRSLSFCVSKFYRRRGYACEAMTALIGYLFDGRGVDYLTSGYFDFNVPSRNLHEKLGFKYLSSAVKTVDGAQCLGVETILHNPRGSRSVQEEKVSEK